MQNETLTAFPGGTATGLDTHSFNDIFSAIGETVGSWKRNHQTRRNLATVDAHILKDIGVTEEDRQAEVKKFFWEK